MINKHPQYLKFSQAKAIFDIQLNIKFSSTLSK